MNHPRRHAPLALRDQDEFEQWLKAASREDLIAELRGVFLARKEHRIDASNDFEAVSAWLSRYANGSTETFRAFKLEAEKLLIWLAREKGYSERNLPSLSNKDAASYIRFLLSPKSEQEFDPELLRIFDRKSQPFDPVPLSVNAVQRARNALNRMFQGLRELRSHNGTYVEINPWFNIRVRNFANSMVKHATESGTPRPTPEPAPPDERIITDEEWLVLLASIEKLPQNTDGERAQYHRTRWVMFLLYYSFLRRSEAASLLMSDFKATRGKWWISVRSGKGGKARRVVASSRLMEELSLYRRSYGLSPYPTPEEQIPAILPLRWKNTRTPEPLTPQVIYQTVKQIVAATALELGDEHPGAIKIAKASPHWTRHTGITHALDRGADARMVQKQAGHASLNTTAIYDHKEKQRWAEEMEKLA